MLVWNARQKSRAMPGSRWARASCVSLPEGLWVRVAHSGGDRCGARWAAQAQPWGLPSLTTDFSSSLTSPETFVSETFVHVPLLNCYQEGNAAIVYLLFLSHGATAVRRWCPSGLLPRSAGCWDLGVWKELCSCVAEKATPSGVCVPLSRCPEDSGDPTGSSPATVTRRPTV